MGIVRNIFRQHLREDKMVQVIHRTPHKTTSDYAADALGAYGESQGRERQREYQKESLAQSDEALRSSGVEVPRGLAGKDRELYITSALKHKFKQEEQEDLLKSITGNREQGNQQPGKQLAQGDEDTPWYERKDPKTGRSWQEEEIGTGQQMQQPEQDQKLEQKIQTEMQQGTFDPRSLSDEDLIRITAKNPAVGRQLQSARETAYKREQEKEKIDIQKQKMSPEYQRQQHLESAQAQADVKYNQQLQEASKQHALKEQTLDRLEILNKKGVTGKPYEKFLEKVGLINLTSGGRREFAADVKNLITDIRSILGAQFTGFEFQTILNAYPNADFSKEANEAIIRNLKDFQDIKSKEVLFASDIKKENGGKIPEDFQSKVNGRVHTYAQSKIPDIKENTRKIMNEEYGIKPGNTLMFDQNREPLNVPDADVAELLESGIAELP